MHNIKELLNVLTNPEHLPQKGGRRFKSATADVIVEALQLSGTFKNNTEPNDAKVRVL